MTFKKIQQKLLPIFDFLYNWVKKKVSNRVYHNSWDFRIETNPTLRQRLSPDSAD